MKLRQLFCIHDYKPEDGYKDRNQNCWIKISKCTKCGKETIEKIWYPAKCKLTGKTCEHHDDIDFDNCRFCDVYKQHRYRHYYD